MSEEFTEEKVEEFLEQFGDMTEDQLINELGAHLLETNPQGVIEHMKKRGTPLTVETEEEIAEVVKQLRAGSE